MSDGYMQRLIFIRRRTDKSLRGCMKVLVTGAGGQLGHDVVGALLIKNHTPYGTRREELDITNRENVERVFADIRPDAVIHCAAWTDVDGAEHCPEQVYKVNVSGTENLAFFCQKYGVKLMYISTEYVFDGSGCEAWKPDSSPASPINVYGRSKYEGELVIEKMIEQYFIVRVSWLFGKNGNNFVKAILQKGREQKEFSVVGDQIGSPTYTKDLADLLVEMIESERFGIYHASGEGVCSRYEYACEILRQMTKRGYGEYDAGHLNVKEILTGDFCSEAKRPLNSRLDNGKLTENHFGKLPDWKDAIGRYLDELGY